MTEEKKTEAMAGQIEDLYGRLISSFWAVQLGYGYSLTVFSK
jgi:hypothetical protein